MFYLRLSTSELFWIPALQSTLKLQVQHYVLPLVNDDLACLFLSLTPSSLVTEWSLIHSEEVPWTLH